MQVGPLILYSGFVGALTGLVAALIALGLSLVQNVVLGWVLGYQPPGLPGEGGLAQVFTGPRLWFLALLPALIFALATVVGTGHGLGWFLSMYRIERRARFLEHLRSSLAAVLQLGSGSPLGREGPMATMGLWIGAAVGRRFPMGGSGRYLPFAGMAAGFAAAFHAPLAAALLASEIVFRGLALEVSALAPALIGALAGFSVYGAILGYGPIFEIQVGTVPWTSLVFGLAVGLLCAGVGALWLEGSYWLRFLVRRLPYVYRHLLLGLLVGAVVLAFPAALGNAMPWVQLGLSPILELRFLAVLFLVQLILLVAAGGVRGYGGYFGPALALGGLVGIIASRITPGFAPPAEAAALAGMAGLLAGIARAPFASVVLACEIGGYSVLPVALPAAFAAYALTNPTRMPDQVAILEDKGEAAAPPPESAPRSEPPPESQAAPGSP
ncbi:chloride channel protein [Calidithermus chliarophilus]|uniref:chloride channel protein n=1 Tax=Calidithermus chliarophilus TaxID=52023 RepID=UPI00041730FD|nr:chloride channel protein [Calidithermus chliarophilus]